MGYSPWGRKESDTSLSDFTFAFLHDKFMTSLVVAG